MADNDGNSKRKKLRLKGTAGKDEKAPEAQQSGSDAAAASGEGQGGEAADTEESGSVQDPLDARDTQMGEKLKRMNAEESPASAQAMTESGRLGPPGSDTVRLKVVKDAAAGAKGEKQEAGETIRLRAGDKSGEGADAEKPAAAAGDTMQVKPSNEVSGDGDTHTATLRVAKHPKQQSSEEQDEKPAPAAASAGETQKAATPSKTATETLRVTPGKGGEENSDKDAGGEAGQTQPVQPKPAEKGGGTSTSTLKVARPGQGAPEASGKESRDAEKDSAETASEPADTQPAVPASGSSKTSTAPLEKESKKKAKEKAKGDNSSKETIRIKPPSPMKTFGQGDQKTGPAEGTGDASAATRKGPAKVTMKVKKREAPSATPKKESQEGKDTVPASPSPEAEPQAQAEQEAPTGRKTLRLKTGADSQDKVSAESVDEAIAQPDAGAEPNAEPGVVLTLVQAASLIGVGVLVFFTAYQYLSLLT